MKSDKASTDLPASHVEALRTLSRRSSGPALVALQGGSRRNARGKATPISRESKPHAHVQGQLICIDDGLMRIHTDRGAWLLQPNRAVWLPPLARHAVSVHGVSTSWNVFVSPLAALELPSEPCVMAISELALALMVRAASWTWQEELEPRQERVLAVLLDELRQAEPSAMHLPLPSDRRLLRIANSILESPNLERTLDEWATWAGLSARTVNRLFGGELGMSFAHWRQQAMLIHAVERLARGENVSVVADALGYASPSNFIAMFRRAFGESPTRYLSHSKAR